MTDDRIWLTYADAAQKLGISIDSVRRRARKEHWGKRKNNLGKLTVSVPIKQEDKTEQKTSHQTEQETGQGPHNYNHELQKKIAILEVQLKAEENRANTAEADRDAWKNQAQLLARPWWKKLIG